MTDLDRASAAISDSIINSQVIGSTPAVSVGSNMLSMAHATSVGYLNAANQQQLNFIAALSAITQNNGPGPTMSPSGTLEAVSLLKQVIASVQAN